MKKVKTCQECGMEFKDQLRDLVDIKKSFIVILRYGNDISVVAKAKLKKWWKKASNKIVDDKLHSEGVLQELKSKIIIF